MAAPKSPGQSPGSIASTSKSGPAGCPERRRRKDMGTSYVPGTPRSRGGWGTVGGRPGDRRSETNVDSEQPSGLRSVQHDSRSGFHPPGGRHVATRPYTRIPHCALVVPNSRAPSFVVAHRTTHKPTVPLKSQIRGAPARRSRGSARDAAAWGRAGPEHRCRRPSRSRIRRQPPGDCRPFTGPGPADAPRCAGDDWEDGLAALPGRNSRRRVWPRGGGGHGVCLCSYSELRLSNSQQKF